MRIHVANNTHPLVHYWAGLYGNLGHLYSPSRKENPYPWLPYILDNGAYSAFKNRTEWDRGAWLSHVERYAFLSLRPLYAIVPDVVADRDATLRNWDLFAPLLISRFHLSLAVAVQDGMTVEDVRSLDPAPDVVFIGGSTEWKWETVGDWATSFPRLHVGRVNGARHLELCRSLRVESCDGTRWFRGRHEQLLELGKYLAREDGSSQLSVEWTVLQTREKTKGQFCLPICSETDRAS